MALAFDNIVNDLDLHGYSVSEDLLSESHVTALAATAMVHQAQGRLVQARTGQTKSENQSLRGDSIEWLDERSPDEPVVACLARFEALRLVLNERLFMNVQELETHFASYPPGAVYQRHLDQFSTGPQSRLLSLVFYLNDGWVVANGGALRLYLGDETESHTDISPTGGRLVLFDSSRFWHEVLPSTRERLSVTGWFRTRSLF